MVYSRVVPSPLILFLHHRCFLTLSPFVVLDIYCRISLHSARITFQYERAIIRCSSSSTTHIFSCLTRSSDCYDGGRCSGNRYILLKSKTPSGTDSILAQVVDPTSCPFVTTPTVVNSVTMMNWRMPSANEAIPHYSTPVSGFASIMGGFQGECLIAVPTTAVPYCLMIPMSTWAASQWKASSEYLKPRLPSLCFQTPGPTTTYPSSSTTSPPVPAQTGSSSYSQITVVAQWR
jgi:hypothetical protein